MMKISCNDPTLLQYSILLNIEAICAASADHQKFTVAWVKFLISVPKNIPSGPCPSVQPENCFYLCRRKKNMLNSRHHIPKTKSQSFNSYSEPGHFVTSCVSLAYPQEKWEFSTIKTNSEKLRFQALLFHDIVIIGSFHFLWRKEIVAISPSKLHLKH